MYKEDIVDIMSNAVEKSITAHQKQRNVSDEEISEMLQWNRPNLDYQNEKVLEEMVSAGLLSVDVI